jgi:hypothetical protein
MKLASLTVFICICTFGVSYAQLKAKPYQNPSQNKSLTDSAFQERINKYNFSLLFTTTDNSEVYGFIGADYERIRMKIISVTKDTISPGIYHVYGKSMVKNNIDDFHGIIKITKILKLESINHGCEDGAEYKGYKGQFSILGEYSFDENPKQKYAGVFKGIFRSDYFIDKNNKVRYDDIEICSDYYTNNQFAGKWISYHGVVKPCNWGDYRIPNSDSLDIGAGEFSPIIKNHGWETRMIGLNQSNADRKKAMRIENAKWWE